MSLALDRESLYQVLTLNALYAIKCRQIVAVQVGAVRLSLQLNCNNNSIKKSCDLIDRGETSEIAVTLICWKLNFIAVHIRNYQRVN